MYAKTQIRLSILLAITLGVLTVIQAWFIANVVDQVFIQQQALSSLLNDFIILVALLCLRALMVYVRSKVAFKAGSLIRSRIRQQLFEKCTKTGPIKSQRFATGEFATLMLENVEKCQGYFADYLPQMMVAVIVPLMILVVVWSQNWMAGVILLITMPLIPLFLAIFGMGAAALHEKNAAALSKMSAHFYDVLCGLATLKYFGQAKAQVEPIRKVSESFRKRTMSVLYVAFLSSSVLEFFSALSVALLATYLGLGFLGHLSIGIHGHLTLKTGLLILILAPEFFMPLRELNTHYHARSEAIGASVKLTEFLALDEMSSGDDLLAEPVRIIQLNQLGIQFDSPVLEGVDYQFEMGKRYGIVGPSGVGKTSILNCLLKLIDPSSGSITVNDLALSDIDLTAWHQNIAYLSQRALLPGSTIRENLNMAGEGFSDEILLSVLKQVDLDVWVQNLPDGLETNIYEQRQGLSGGQANRLALARSILKDAPIWILDEPTASLDEASAAALMKTIEAHSKGKLLIMVTHDQRHIEWLDDVWSLGSESSAFEASNDEAPIIQHAVQPRDQQETHQKPFSIARMFWRYKGWMLLGLVLSTATLLAGIGLLALSGWFISAAAFAGLTTMAASQFNYFLPAAGVRFFALLRIVSRYGERVVTHQATFKILSALRVGVYQLIEPLAPAHLLRYKSGDLQSRLVSDIEALDNLYLRFFAPCISAVLAIIFVGFLFCYFDPFVAVIAVVALLVTGFTLPLLSALLGKKSSSAIAELQSNYRVKLTSVFSNLTPLLLTHQLKQAGDKLAASERDFQDRQKSLATVDGLSAALFSLFSGAALIAVLFVAALHTHQGTLNGAFIALLALATMGAFEAVMPLSRAFKTLGQTRASIKRINELKVAKPAVDFVDQKTAIDAKPALSVEQLSFAYDGKPVLKDFSFELEPGAKIAITGQSGVGKSTLLHLILRAFDPDSGAIKLGGVNLKAIDETTLRENLLIIRQSPFLFNSSIRDNLSLHHSGISESKMVDAIRLVQLGDWFSSLPDGLDSQIGEQGAMMSGGQRQRLAIARAICFDAPIWLIDEPTEGLDAHTEQKLIKDMSHLLHDKTLVLVTHRKAPLALVDQIINLDQVLSV